MGKRHLLHVRSSQLVDNAPKLPTSGDINYGELAINYADGNETLSLKNSANQIISFNIGKSIKSINVNNVPATITNNVASVTISGSDVNVGTYVPVSYPQEFTAATPVSGSQTIAEAFNSVETTISAVTQELLDDEEVLEKSIIALGEAAGTIDGEYNIAYLPNTSATYISSATSLYDADNQLDEAISSLSSETSDALSSITVNGIESTTTDKNASVDISGHNITLGNYTSVEYPTDFSAATNVSGTQTVSEAINAVESTLAVLSDEMIKDEKVVSESIVQLANSAGLNNDGEITYSADTNANYISGATSLFDADTILDSKINDIETSVSIINYAESQTNPGGPAKMAVSIPSGKLDSTSVATAMTATVSGITELRDGVCCLLTNGVIAATTASTLNINDLGAKPLYATTSAATKSSIFGTGYTMLFIYNETRVEGGCWDVYYGYDSDKNTDTIGYNISPLYGKKAKSTIYRYEILFTYNETYLIPVNSSSNVTATSKTLTSESFDPFGDIYYYSVTATTSADTIITTGRVWTEYAVDLRYSFNEASGLTARQDIYLICVPQSDGKVKLLDGGHPITQTLPNTEDGYVYKKLGFAYSTYQMVLTQDKPCYYFKDGQIRLWTNQTETDISGKADINHTHVSSEVTIEENYQTIEYPSALESAVTVESGQTVSEAFNAVETTIDLLAQEVIDNEEVVAEAFTKMGDAAGLYGTSSQIAYQPDTSAHYISGATSLFNADVALDTALYSVASGAQNSLSSITVNGINGTTTNKNASVTISGQNISVGTYTAVTYPTPFTSATPVSGSQTLPEAFNSVETTVSALTQEVIDNELVTEKGFVSVAKALGIDEESEIEYVPNANTNYIAYATSYQNADELLDAALQGLSAGTHNAISNVVLNGITGTVTNRNSEISVSGSDISVGTYTPIVYPSSFTSATNVTSSQTLNQAFSAVETTISAVTEELADKADKVFVINHGTSDTTFAITPNKHHIWGSVQNLTLTLAPPTDNTIVNEYLFTFTSPSIATTLTLPSSVLWSFELEIETGKTYVVSIIDNLATYLTNDMEIIGADEATLALKEDIANKVTTIDINSSDVQYPSAKCVYDYIESKLAALQQT